MKRVAINPVRDQSLRLSILVIILISALVSLCFKVHELNTSTYAYTMSLGNGYGFVVYTEHYKNLAPRLQASVRLHEGVHLRDGTFSFWNYNESEIAAYREQLDAIFKELETLKQDYRRTGDPSYMYDYHELKAFQREVEDNMKSYMR